MKRFLISLAVMTCALVLAACGGGGGGGGTPPAGPIPGVVYMDNAVRNGDDVTLTWQVDPKGLPADTKMTVTDGNGWTQMSNVRVVNGTGFQLIQETFTGVPQSATITATPEATNVNGTASDFGMFQTWASPPAITGSTVTNITRNSADIVFTVDPSLDPSMRQVYLYVTDPAGGNRLELGPISVPSGIDNVTFSVTGYADNTLIEYWLAAGFDWGFWVSQTAQSFWTLPPPGTCSAPTFSPSPGTYNGSQNVAISSATPGASIRYTTNGSDPTSSYGTPYTVPVVVSDNTTLKAIAFQSGWNDSPVTSGVYTITPAGTGTINLLTYAGDNVFIYTETNQLVRNMVGDGQWHLISLPAAGYKLKVISSNTIYTCVDSNDNNIFRLEPNGTLNIGTVLSAAAGRLRMGTGGTGFSTDREATVAVGSLSIWEVRATITDNTYPVPPTSLVYTIYTQTENLVSFEDPYIGTVWGTINGNLMSFYAYAYNGAQMVTYYQVVVLNAAGTSFTGTVYMKLDGVGELTANITGTR